MKKSYAMPFEGWWKRHYKKLPPKALWKWEGYQPVTVQFIMTWFFILLYLADKLTPIYNTGRCEWNVMMAGASVGQMWVWYCCRRFHSRDEIRKIMDEELNKAIVQAEAERIKDGGF
ncbi:MAG: hypothetical protein WC208_10435 [Gallionella sp.]|jgi:hypothetical protein